ncbi:5771_t:CDS:2 [Gigaspora rosea]|nr:5771_t:CDS:2 [Gigaspora rosea]
MNSTKLGKTVKIECQWHVNLSRLLKQNLKNNVYITILNDEHNHDMCPEALQFERDKAFTKEMRVNAEFYVKCCHFSATLIRWVLKQKYPSYFVFPEDLYKEIQKCKPLAQFNESDAARFYEELLDKQHKDPQWFVEKATRGYMPGVIITDGDPAMYRAVLIELLTTRHLFCIWHIKENLKKMLRAKLGAEFDSFYSAFWKCRNSNTPESFEYY